MSLPIRWATAWTSDARPVASAAGNPPTASRSAEPAACWRPHGHARKSGRARGGGRGLGGRARCRGAPAGGGVVGATHPVAEAAAGTELGRRSGMPRQVQLVPAAAAALPFRPARFTHVWFVESLSGVSDPGAALAEAHRVVRPGGGIAIQDLFGTRRAAVEIGSWPV